MSRTKLQALRAVQYIAGQAAYDAADFKLSDPTSVTTVHDCASEIYKTQRANALGVFDKGTYGYIQAEELWDLVCELLHNIGFKLDHN